MEKYDPRIDAYIEKSQGFAKPILNHLRSLVHQACPDMFETIKWGFPHFDYKGTVCSMAAFKQHCAFGFWKSSLIEDPLNLLSGSREAMGQLGRISSIEDLPDKDTLIKYIRNTVKLNEEGIKVLTKKPAKDKPEIQIPDYFTEALKANAAAMERFEKFSYSHRKEYLLWLTEAKSEDTRQKRMATAIEWISEGKGRNWKYEKK